jgi:hypothetical protein
LKALCFDSRGIPAAHNRDGRVGICSAGVRNPTLAQIHQHTSRSFGRKTAWFYVVCDGKTEEAGTRAPVEDMISTQLDRPYDAKGALFPINEDQVMHAAASWSINHDRFDKDLSVSITGDGLTVGTLARPK